MITINRKNILKLLKRDKYLIIMVLPAFVLLILFRYLPIYGILVAFQDYRVSDGFFGSKWVGLKHFFTFFSDSYSWVVFRNTIMLNIYALIFCFPAPIIFAVLLNELKLVNFKRICQTITYMPNFISVVIVIGLVKEFTAYKTGIINDIIEMFGGERITFLLKPYWFIFFYIATALWQGTGFGSIIYLAALTNINPELYESAYIDGATRLKKIIHIDIPSIVPVITISLILSMGGMLGSDFQKILLLYNELTYSVADVLSTYLYRAGILGASFSFATAVGLFTSLVSFLFLFAANQISRKVSETSFW